MKEIKPGPLRKLKPEKPVKNIHELRLFRPQTQHKERRALKIIDDGQCPPHPQKKETVSVCHRASPNPIMWIKDKAFKTAGEK